MSLLIYEEARGILVVFLRNIIHDACVYCEYRHAKTLTATDIVLALKRNGRVVSWLCPSRRSAVVATRARRGRRGGGAP